MERGLDLVEKSAGRVVGIDKSFDIVLGGGLAAAGLVVLDNGSSRGSGLGIELCFEVGDGRIALLDSLLLLVAEAVFLGECVFDAVKLLG